MLVHCSACRLILHQLAAVPRISESCHQGEQKDVFERGEVSGKNGIKLKKKARGDRLVEEVR